jgi:hypothetical protein
MMMSPQTISGLEVAQQELVDSPFAPQYAQPPPHIPHTL